MLLSFAAEVPENSFNLHRKNVPLRRGCVTHTAVQMNHSVNERFGVIIAGEPSQDPPNSFILLK
jgi:hypothetical protein